MSKAMMMATALWAGSLAIGIAALAHYQGAPGAQAAPPAELPAIPGVRPTPGAHTLILAIHPHCPCSHASAAELERLLSELRRRGISAPEVYALIYRPSYADDPWADSGLRDRLAAIQGISLIDDPDGVHGASIGALTSGHAVLFDPGSRPLYRGGITAARGHEGDNVGKLALLDHLDGRRGSQMEAVYGCPLDETD